jgi:hypothetical protein
MCISECTIRVTARLRNCGDRLGEIIHDTVNYILKFIWFTYKIISIIY